MLIPTRVPRHPRRGRTCRRVQTEKGERGVHGELSGPAGGARLVDVENERSSRQAERDGAAGHLPFCNFAFCIFHSGRGPLAPSRSPTSSSQYLAAMGRDAGLEIIRALQEAGRASDGICRRGEGLLRWPFRRGEGQGPALRAFARRKYLARRRQGGLGGDHRESVQRVCQAGPSPTGALPLPACSIRPRPPVAPSLTRARLA